MDYRINNFKKEKNKMSSNASGPQLNSLRNNFNDLVSKKENGG